MYFIHLVKLGRYFFHYTLLTVGYLPFAFRTFPGYTSMMQIFSSTTSQSCFIGLRSV